MGRFPWGGFRGSERIPWGGFIKGGFRGEFSVGWFHGIGVFRISHKRGQVFAGH